jgi:hypothetical protein
MKKDEVIKLVKILGIGLNELVITINLDGIIIDTIEYDKKTNKLFVNAWVTNEMEVQINYDDLNEKNQMMIYYTLSSLINN